MNKGNIKSILVGIPLFAILFGGSYLWRQQRDKDISDHSKYAIGHIQKKTGSLTSGEQWHYEFEYKESRYKGYRSTHVDYNVHLGDYFLVVFSSKDPDHNQILYEYKLKDSKRNYVDSIWDTIPRSILYSGLK